MYRIGLVVLGLAPLLGRTATAQSNPAPMVNFSFYAPAQEDPPVRIVGFEHDKSEIRFVLSNTSNKSVVAVALARVDVVPRGCGGVNPGIWVSGGGFKVSIPARGTGIADRVGIVMVGSPPPSPQYPHYPMRSVYLARSAGAARLQAQFGITGVRFQDGTSWPPGIGFLLKEDFDPSKQRSAEEVTKASALQRSRPFDDELAEAEDGKCTDAANVVKALESVKEVIFDREDPEAANGDDKKGAVPQLHFSCRLEGPKAVCRLPLEKTSAQSRAVAHARPPTIVTGL